jgi:hypothetical protein
MGGDVNDTKINEGRDAADRIRKLLHEVKNWLEEGNQLEGDGHPECPFALCKTDVEKATVLVSALGVSLDHALERERREKRSLVAWMANVEERQEIDLEDLEARIAAARADGRDHVAISARDLWRMASDRRGRDEE